MSKKLSLIFLLLGGILTIVGGTMLSIKDSKKDKEKSIEESKSLDEDAYMPIIYKISDKDNYIYLVPSFNHGDSNSKKISSKFYNILDKSTIIVEYDDTKTNQLDFDNNFILEEDDYLDNCLKADCVYVCNKDGYIGGTVSYELGTLQCYGQEVFFMEEPLGCLIVPY